MAVTPDEQQSIIDKLLELFQSNEAAIQYGEDPGNWVDENLPEGTEAADVASCMPEVAERMGGPYQSNAAQYNAYHGSAGSAATTSVVNEISYTYNTIYQQNAFIYAEEGAQVTNIQGDGNSVNQQQIDDSFNAEHPDGWDDYEPEDGEYEEPGYEEGEDGYEPGEGEYEEPEGEDGDYEEGDDTGMDGGMEDGGMEPPMDGGMEPGYEDPTMGMDDGGYEDGGMDTGMDDGGMEPPMDDGGMDDGGMEGMDA